MLVVLPAMLLNIMRFVCCLFSFYLPKSFYLLTYKIYESLFFSILILGFRNESHYNPVHRHLLHRAGSVPAAVRFFRGPQLPDGAAGLGSRDPGEL